MKITKATIKRIIKKTCKESNFVPDRDQKFSMFCHVCDNLYNEGTITFEQHKSFTQVF